MADTANSAAPKVGDKPEKETVTEAVDTELPEKDKSAGDSGDETSEADETRERCFLCPVGHAQSRVVGDVETWLECNHCTRWAHASCSRISKRNIHRVESYSCTECEPMHGPTTFKERAHALRNVSQVDYANLNKGLPGDPLRFTKVVASRKFTKDAFLRMDGHDVTLEWVRKTGMPEPFIMQNADGLDMAMPSSSLTVRQIGEIVGMDTRLAVMDVPTQADLPDWRLADWVDYFESPKPRDRILNVISLEISHTTLGAQVKRPRLVRDLDWVDNAWPHNQKTSSTDYPKVQTYCLMSVAESFTDFHIDFGGTSVYYHVLSGAKMFYFIRPTPSNLRAYERWSASPDQAGRFLADEVKECYEVHITAGNTMIIPTGWIHAVYTPVDSVVIGGNYLHGLDAQGQFAIYDIETRTNVPLKFRFPYFVKMIWYVGRYYQRILDQAERISLYEFRSIGHISAFLFTQADILPESSNAKSEERRRARAALIPSDIPNQTAISSAIDAARRLRSSFKNALRHFFSLYFDAGSGITTLDKRIADRTSLIKYIDVDTFELLFTRYLVLKSEEKVSDLTSRPAELPQSLPVRIKLKVSIPETPAESETVKSEVSVESKQELDEPISSDESMKVESDNILKTESHEKTKLESDQKVEMTGDKEAPGSDDTLPAKIDGDETEELVEDDEMASSESEYDEVADDSTDDEFVEPERTRRSPVSSIVPNKRTFDAVEGAGGSTKKARASDHGTPGKTAESVTANTVAASSLSVNTKISSASPSTKSPNYNKKKSPYGPRLTKLFSKMKRANAF